MAQYISRTSLRNTLRLSRTTPRKSPSVTAQYLQRIQVRLMSTETSSTQPSYEYILVSRPEPSVVLVTLNRPKALNALCSPLFAELNKALEDADKDDTVGAMVLTGSEKAFAGMFVHMSLGLGR